MRSLGSLGYALSVAALATAAQAAPDSRAPLPAEDLNAAQMERVGSPPPTHGGWARDGWADDAGPGPRADAPPPADFHNGRADADGPPPQEWRDAGMDRGRGMAAGRSDDWRRQTWDGGRGDAFAYRRGGRLPAIFVSPRYAVPDWEGYRLAPPGPGRRWVRYYDDAVLIDGRGRVVDAVPAVGWDDDYRGRPWRDGPWRDRPWRGGGPIVEHHGPGPAPEIHYGPGGATTIIIRTAPSVTTTTTTETYVTTSRKRVWKPAPTKLVPRRTVQTKPGRTVQTKPGR